MSLTTDVWDDPNYVFEYDPTSKSCLRWRNHKRHKSLIGTECGTRLKKFGWAVQFRGKPRLVHRVVWEMFNGPLSDIDIVRAKNDNLWDARIENLYVERGAYKNPQADAIANGDWPKVFGYTDDGDLVWLHDFWSGNNLAVKNASAGDRIEKWVDMDGYYVVKLGKYRKSQIKLHKVIYEWHYGAIQAGMVVDHINRDITDNRIENLRAVTCAANSRNRSMDKRNSTGYTGVRYRDGAYIAMWNYDGKHHQKSFSINKYGKERAFQLAIDYRAAKIAELNSMYGDEGYTSNHGT